MSESPSEGKKRETIVAWFNILKAVIDGYQQKTSIVHGVQKAIASRITALAGKKIATPIVFTGGVALVSGMSHALEEALQHKITVAAEPQMTGALGAALLAAKNNSVKK